jgi:hypothetical protein
MRHTWTLYSLVRYVLHLQDMAVSDEVDNDTAYRYVSEQQTPTHPKWN